MICTSCDTDKPAVDFYAGRRQCRACVLDKQRCNPNRAQRQRQYHLERSYGITLEQYDAMVEAQCGVCAICGKPPPGRFALSVDHDHDTGRIRGLLCNPCNSLMGRWGDDAEILMAAARYLS